VIIHIKYGILGISIFSVIKTTIGAKIIIVGILLIKIVIKKAIYENIKNNLIGLHFTFFTIFIAI
jgi:hypothetical protein